LKRIAPSGFTLVEMLVSIAILGITAVTVIPSLSSSDPQRLDVAAEETANMLRFALSEAGRTGGYVLVDGKTTLGQLKLYYSNASGNLGVEVKDPLTKRAAILDVGGSPFSQGVSPTPKFRGNGVIRQQLLIGATASGLTLESMNGIGSKGVLEPNSGVLLGYGGQSVTVSLNEATGLVSLP